MSKRLAEDLYIEFIVWYICAVIAIFASIYTLLRLYKMKVKIPFCLQLIWIILFNNLAVFVFQVFFTFRKVKPHIYIPLYAFGIGFEIAMVEILHWYFGFRYFRASMDLPKFLNVQNIRDQ